ncbi:aspartyl protease [Edaphobacter aggregans]|uniref:Aspartyl protease n=1 Tax=Edaphobacter aggregans TaxID=570835 RepID=A0A3R9P1M5_9BACT|nr:retropepsin-like aspartic protease [Edaphobacter aggregans]RSL19055.1 aspartyl protease [Edaphobacter aggregans]
MKHALPNSHIQLFVAISLATIRLSVLQAEPHCPGSIASVTPRFVQHALIVIPVRINRAGPFDFMVDTGSQITVVEPSLAAELHLKLRGTVGLVSVASYAQVSVTVLDSLEANSHVVEKPLAVVQNLRQIQAADPQIRGVLGENFLAHFDLFIDYAHKLLCLDETRAMLDSVHGEHIPLVTPQHPEDELPFAERLVISVHLSDTGSRRILLQLDSGSDSPILYARSKGLRLQWLEHATLQGEIGSKTQQAFTVLPQDMQIGTRTMSHISFVTPVSVGKNVPLRDEDGVLPTLIFQRVFICPADHYVVFDPR